MNSKSTGGFVISAMLFVLFILFTLLVRQVDVQPIGPEGSSVGFAAVNGAVFSFFGTSMVLFKLAEYLGLFAILIAVGFVVTGLVQFFRRKSLWKVDHGILLMGVLFAVTIVIYFLFEHIVINYRPIILENELEASYPSSHTLLVIVILGSAIIQFHRLFKGKKGLLLLLDIFPCILIVGTILARLASGAHWLTDIIGGVLLACTLITLYYSFVVLLEPKAEN
ncbi:MAG: phosphatase PAP2 family protein [Oscillospiraceae bacterium]|nr:phosphatase PAP2 family protein [Oscillospiraceae bacterium]